MRKEYSYEDVEVACRTQNGGRNRLICNRTINGQKCVCFAKEVVLGDTRYWNLHYRIDGEAPVQFNSLVNEMYEIAHAKSVELYSKGVLVILWSY